MANVKPPLILKDNACRNMNELKENFNIKEIFGYFLDGKLHKWLKDRYYTGEAAAIENLSKEDKNVPLMLCEIFKIDPKSQDFGDIADIDELMRQKEKLRIIKENTDDEYIISHPEIIALDQEELAELLDNNVKDIYLCEGEFIIPIDVENKNYHGVSKLKKLIVTIPSDTQINFETLNITFENLEFDEEYKKIKPTQPPKPPQPQFDEEISHLKEQIKKEKLLKKKFELYLRCAELDDVESMFEVGERLLKANGTFRNNKQAIEWFKKAAELGHIEAMKKLAQIYNEGQIIKKDNKKAFEYYEKAANLGDIFSMRSLAKLYEWGAGVEKNIDKAIEWSIKANDLANERRLIEIRDRRQL